VFNDVELNLNFCMDGYLDSKEKQNTEPRIYGYQNTEDRQWV